MDIDGIYIDVSESALSYHSRSAALRTQAVFGCTLNILSDLADAQANLSLR